MSYAYTYLLFKTGTPMRRIVTVCRYRTISDVQQVVDVYESWRSEYTQPTLAIKIDTALRAGHSTARVATAYGLSQQEMLDYSHRRHGLIDGWVRSAFVNQYIPLSQRAIERYCREGLLITGIANGDTWIKVQP